MPEQAYSTYQLSNARHCAYIERAASNSEGNKQLAETLSQVNQLFEVCFSQIAWNTSNTKGASNCLTRVDYRKVTSKFQTHVYTVVAM